jgi:hypothetical protein
MSRPGIEPGPPVWEASTLEKSHLDSLFASYSEPLLELRWRSARGLYNLKVKSILKVKNFPCSLHISIKQLLVA